MNELLEFLDTVATNHVTNISKDSSLRSEYIYT